MAVSASVLLANPVANTQTQQPANIQGVYLLKNGQLNGPVMKHCKCKMPQHSAMQRNMMKKKMRMHQMKMNSPFLIKHGLPHLTMMIMPYMNDPAFNLTVEQKKQLAKVRETTMSAIREAKPKVTALRKQIVKASQAGVSADTLKDPVVKLALLEATVTMTHLKCIEATKAILTKDQLYFLLTNKNKKRMHARKQMMMRKGMQK